MAGAKADIPVQDEGVEGRQGMPDRDSVLAALVADGQSLVHDQLPDLIGLAETVATVARDDPRHPAELVVALIRVRTLLIEQLRTEAGIVHPLIRLGGSPMLADMIRGIQAGQAEIERELDRMLSMTDGLKPPPDVTPSWAALYVAIGVMADRIRRRHALARTDVYGPLVAEA